MLQKNTEKYSNAVLPRQSPAAQRALRARLKRLTPKVTQIAHARAARWPGLEAEDIAQEMYLGMLRFGERPDAGDGLYVRIAERDASDLARRSCTYNNYVGTLMENQPRDEDAIILDAADLFPSPEESVEAKAERRVALEAIVTQLGPECREVLQMLAEGFCAAEISRVKSVPSTTIRRRVDTIRAAAIAAGLR